MARGKMVYVKAKKTKPYEGGHWNQKKKYECVCLWLTGIPLTQVAVEANVPVNTVREWRTMKWWNDIVDDIRSEDKQRLDAKLSNMLDKTLDEMMDRLENGEYVYDQKSGKLKRSPVKLRDTTTTFNTLMDKRQLIRKEPTKITETSSTATQLANLAKQFESFVNGQAAVEHKEKVVAEYIDEDTVVQDVDGTYILKEDQDAVSN